MNRVGVVSTIREVAPLEGEFLTAGELLMLNNKGEVITDTTAMTPLEVGSRIEFILGLGDGKAKSILTLDPYHFDYEEKVYAAGVGKVIEVGSSSVADKLVVANPATNVGKCGSLYINYLNKESALAPLGGEQFVEPIDIVAGDTEADILTKLVAAGNSLVSKINTKYGSTTITMTSDVVSANKYLQFTFDPGFLFNVVIDGIFDGTLVDTTMGADGPFKSGLEGADVIAAEKEAAILDGYNPTQTDHRQAFDIDSYILGDKSATYNGFLITTQLPKEYNSPGNPEGWGVSTNIYIKTTDTATITSMGNILFNLKINNI